jgi:predicted O-methyltransferase YrrM
MLAAPVHRTESAFPGLRSLSIPASKLPKFLIIKGIRMNLSEAMERARSAAELRDLNDRVVSEKIRTWSSFEERSLLFGLAAFGDDIRTIVEIGSFCGGSAAFLAGGLRHRDDGRIYCVDPFLGAPPWLGVPSISWTLEEFFENIRALGLDRFVAPCIGTSTAVAAVWPGLPIDLLFIDGDHSFLGAMADIESWIPKLREGGLFLIDDVDNIPELEVVTRILREMQSLHFEGRVGGIDTYTVVNSGWSLLAEISNLLEHEGVPRPWNYRSLHATRGTVGADGTLLPTWRNRPKRDNHEEARALISHVIAGHGDYAYTEAAHRAVRDMVYEVSLKRGDGKLFKIDGNVSFPSRFRAIACGVDEVARVVPMLAPGGILMARTEKARTQEQLEDMDRTFKAAGLVGTGFHDDFPHYQWGVADPYSLSNETILARRLARARKM